MEVRVPKMPKDKTKIPVINTLAPLWPSRVCFIGAPGTGKTTAMIDVVERYMPNTTLLVCARNLDHPVYTAFRERVERYEAKIGECTSVWVDRLKDVPPLSDINKDNRTLAIFDDILKDPDLVILEDWAIRSRQRNCTMFIAAQGWFELPKLVRNSTTQVALWRGLNGRDQSAIYKDLNVQLTKDDFVELYKRITGAKHGFIYVDSVPVDPLFAVRIGFDRAVNKME